MRAAGKTSLRRCQPFRAYWTLLLCPLVECLDQTIDAVLANLLSELVAIVFDQPDIFDVQVVDLPALGRFFQAIVECNGLRVGALRDLRLDHRVRGARLAPKG